jgi:chromosome segregation ATPase
MADRQEIEQLRTRYQQAQQDLAVAEKEVSTAQEGLTSVEEELKGLGFDPASDLDAQLQAKEGELDGILANVEQLLVGSEEQLAEQPIRNA